MKWWIVLIIVVVAAGAAFAGGMAYEKSKADKPADAPATV